MKACANCRLETVQMWPNSNSGSDTRCIQSIQSYTFLRSQILRQSNGKTYVVSLMGVLPVLLVENVLTTTICKEYGISYKMLSTVSLYQHTVRDGYYRIALFCSVYICFSCTHIELQIIWRKVCAFSFDLTQVDSTENTEGLPDRAPG